MNERGERSERGEHGPGLVGGAARRPGPDGGSPEGAGIPHASGRPPRQRARGGQHPGEAWNVFGTLIAGMAFWGLVGFGADRLFGFRALFLPIGLAVGMGAAMYLVIYRLTQR
ncbi:AtpZ/AtpI family protein [Frankia alni]|uniref:AtpZ/AtpI family protein n=1 Tax=Frankia alni TaxID=1859 RepID=UPI000315BFC0|nr:hypothetical protein [Frankia alni]